MRRTKRGLGILLCAAALTACGARSSLLDVDSWLEDERKERAGTGGQGGAPLDPGHDEVCGNALKGPFMVRVPLPDGGSFCIDSVEVSNTQYWAFVQAAVPFSQQPAICAWNDSYSQGYGDWLPADNLPAVLMDWCDARAYCAWAGKRLCGKIGGGHIPVASPPDMDEVDPLGEEWAYACTAGGTRVFPYGDVYEKTGCVTLDYASDPAYLDSEIRLRPSREAKKCQGGFPGLYDMGGNASEWIDESYEETGKNDDVIMFGADYGSGESDAKCIYRESATRDDRNGGTGIRCCKEGP